MHANAPNPRKQAWYDRFARSGYFLGAVLLHLIVFLMIATVVIWKAPPPPPIDVFHGVAVKVPPPPPQPPPPPSTAPVNPQMEPEQVTVPVSTPRSAITSVNTSFTIDTSKLLDQALNHLGDQAPKGTGLGTGPGSSGGTGGGYGVAGTTPSFVGTLYDLKQTPDHKRTDIAQTQAEQNGEKDPDWEHSAPFLRGLEVLRDFVKAWDMSELDKYYKAPNTLSATQICIPVTPSENAPIAFNVEGTVQPYRWIVIYHARIIPPESGEFRFIGFADDYMVVRVDQQNVLDASLSDKELVPEANVDLDVGKGPENQPLKCGKWIQMEAGTPMDMQVLIGEGPGGQSGFLLMIQKQGDNSPKGDYRVFQLQDSDVPEMGAGFEFSQKKMLFKVAP